jgi:hypothetical protein
MKNDYQNKESTILLWFQLFNHVILRLPRKGQAKKQVINLCRQYYRGNAEELNLIHLAISPLLTV